MESVETLRQFFGWCTVINIGILLFSSISVVLMRSPISNIHAKLFGLTAVDLAPAYFQYLAQYKIAIIVFNLAPYIALRITS